MRFGRDPTTDPFGGCFWAEFRELPPRFPGGIPAVCRLPQTTRKRTRGRTSGSSMRESGALCDCAVCFFQLCSESSQSRAFSAPHFAKATSWLGSCTCMGTGEGRYGGAGGRGGGSMWSTIKKANPQLARASFWPLQEEARSFALSRDIFLPGRRSVDAAPFPTPRAHVSLANVSP